MLNFRNFIRLVFSLLMLLPFVILVYFIINWPSSRDCLALYTKNRSVKTVAPIAWPQKGLITLWFEGALFYQNAQSILPLMDKYQFRGVISLESGKSCSAQFCSINQLIALRNHGWEITANHLQQKQQHKINDMPIIDPTKIVFYDVLDDSSHASISAILKETKKRNGWVVFYIHAQKTTLHPINITQLNQVLRVIKYSNIPVVLQEQVLRVSA